MSAEDGKISKAKLKLATGEFDVESIHTLVLSNSDITDLGCLGECTGLERLDLSCNDISKLHKLAGLTSLQALNLSSNRISSLDGLQSLENLRSLNLAGNLIGSVDSLRCLCGLEHLKELRMRDEGRDLSNPACMLPSYISDTLCMLPSLVMLDGHRVRGRGSELFHTCQDMEKMLNSLGENKDIGVPLIDLRRQPSDLWTLPDPVSARTLNRTEDQLRDLLTSCQHLSKRAAEKIEELHSSQSIAGAITTPVAMDTTTADIQNDS